MIVYRNHTSVLNTNNVMDSISQIVDDMHSGDANLYENAVELLIETGELETGITDIICNNYDCLNDEIVQCRKMSVLAGTIFHSLWASGTLLTNNLQKIKFCLQRIKSFTKLPQKITIGVPEGFVYYSLYPEIYLEAAEKFYLEEKPKKVIVIGLRSIGTQLSALVTAYLESYGCEVTTITLRPKGHPFNRHVVLSDKLKELFKNSIDTFVAIVDEGPGLSGSSIGGTLQEMLGLGIATEKTVIFPSWLPDSSSFISNTARNLWNRYKKYVGSFENQWIFNGKLEQFTGKKVVYDLSAGIWREHFITNKNEYPPVHPHHERRKYLLVDCYMEDPVKQIAKFAGLGKFGRNNYRRALQLSESRYIPKVAGYTAGFILMDYVNGDILNSNSVNDKLIDFVTDYLGFIKRNMPVTQCVSYDHMMQMIYENVKEGLGERWCLQVDKLKKIPRSYYDQEVVKIDGRMMPHEFLQTDTGILKTDFLEHHNDQFFHGPQNIAWDIAAFCVEFNLDQKKRSDFLEKVITVDKQINTHISFFTIAYLSYRLGYVSLASESIAGGPDSLRFLNMKKRYSSLLKDELQQL